MFTDLFSKILNRNLSKRKIDFAFLIHPRYTADIFKKYKFLKLFPNFIIEFILLYFWPTYGGTIKGLSRDGKNIWGALIIVPLTSKQMLSKRDLAKKKVASAVNLAKIYGAEIVGLGALTSAVTGGGEDIKHLVHPVHLTSGNSLTAYTTYDDVRAIIEKQGIAGPIAIVGVTGSIGRAVAVLLSESVENELIIIGKNEERTHAIKDQILNSDTATKTKKIVSSTNIKDIQSAEIIIVTTSATGAVITDELVSSAKVIYDVTQPKNTPDHIQKSNTLTFIDGGLIKLPEYITITLDIGLPKGISFSCLSETMLISASERHDLVSKSLLETSNIRKIGEIAKKHNFVSHLIYGRDTEHTI